MLPACGNLRERVSHIGKYFSLNTTAERDMLLDFCKGIAITLVVVGHTIQGNSAEFDVDQGFRFIYSFHMPMFAMLAGASAAFWINKFNVLHSSREAVYSSFSRVRKSAEYLLIPFFLWTIIGYFINGFEESFNEYMWKVINHPDYSLWFLPCIFWCTVYAAIFMLASAVVQVNSRTTRFGNVLQHLQNPILQAFLMLLLWKLISPRLPVWGGLVFANQFHGGLFLFFLAGLAFFRKFSNTNLWWVRLLPYGLFFGLVSFWHRTMPWNLIEQAPAFLLETSLRKYYSMIVATAGSLVFIDLSRVLISIRFKYLNLLVAYIGVASLGIYAVHFYFLGSAPRVIAPIAISLIIWQFFQFIPVFGKLLFGK